VGEKKFAAGTRGKELAKGVGSLDNLKGTLGPEIWARVGGGR